MSKRILGILPLPKLLLLSAVPDSVAQKALATKHQDSGSGLVPLGESASRFALATGFPLSQVEDFAGQTSALNSRALDVILPRQEH